MSFSNILLNRKSTRKFNSNKVEPNKIELLKKAALLSPTGKRKNHWDFVFIENKETLAKLSTSKEHGSKLIENAALAIVIIGDLNESDTWIEDCSIASIILQLQAEELGLGSCWVQIHKREHSKELSAEDYIKELLQIPCNKNVLSIIAIGYPLEERAPNKNPELLYHKIHLEKF